MSSQNKSWRFELYVTGESARSRAALANLERICSASLGRDYSIRMFDLTENPELWRKHQLLATPAAIRRLPLPERRVIGDMSVEEQVLKGLGIPKPAASQASTGMPEVSRG